MNLITQDVTSKKLLLIYCIDNIRDKFARIESRIDDKSRLEKFNEAVYNLSSICFLYERVEVYDG